MPHGCAALGLLARCAAADPRIRPENCLPPTIHTGILQP